jgi:uncharacterized protein involved in exopolysaccharide biosynthesis
MITRNTSYGHSLPPAPQATMGLRQWCGAFYRHKGKMLAVFCTIMALFVVGLIVYPRSYTSEARLFVRLGKESVSLDPTATIHETIQVNESRESEINSELEILRSRALLEDVVNQLGADEILSTSDKAEAGLVDSLMLPVQAVSTWLNGAVSAEEKAITKLEKSIGISSPRKSSVLVVSSKARDPRQAQKILESFLGAYQVRHGKANRIAGSYDFFVTQTNLLNEQLTKAKEDLRDAKSEDGVASIEGQRANVEAQANSIEVAMLENQRLLSAEEAKVTALKKTLNELPAMQLDEQLELPSAAADTMRNELYLVQIKEKEASSRFTALHPTVIALRKQVEETRKILANEEGRASHSTKRLSPVHQSVQTELATTEALAAAHRAQSESLKSQFEAVQTKIRALNDDELRITDLSLKAKVLEESYLKYATNREQARIDSALETGRVSNVNVVQPPSYVAKASSPLAKMTLAMGFLVALAGAVLVALVAEYFDRSLRSAEQIENELGLPVLFSVPRGTRHEMVQN